MKRPAVFSLCLIAAALAPSALAADDAAVPAAPPAYRQEGRVAAPVPGGAGSVQLTPPPTGAPGSVHVGTPGSSDPQYGAVLYEKNRIKRTVPLDPAAGLDGTWDVLYTYVDTVGGADQPGGSGVRTVYMDWDDTYLYLALEMPKPAEVRFDIDGKNDGWLRGADNLAIQVSPPAQAAGAPAIDAQRFDALQNRDRPVFAASPIPADAMKAAAGTTPRGNYAVTLAIPRTELIGLQRKTGSSFGFRVETGVAAPQDSGGDVLLVRPMLRLTLADSVPAAGDGGLQVHVGVTGSHTVAPGDDMTLTLEARNAGTAPITLSHLFLRGSLGSENVLDAATFNGVVLAPGQRFSRDLRSSVAATASTGTYVATGGAERDDGSSIVSLVSFDRIEPFALDLAVDTRPVAAHAAPETQKNGVHGWVRQAAASVVGRVAGKTLSSLRLQLPEGWSLDGGDLSRTVTLRFASDTQAQYFRIIVPAGTAPGAYTVKATLDASGHSYEADRTITVQ